MITFLRGRIAEKQPTRLVLDVGGVGYEVFIPLSSYDRLPSEGSEATVLTFDYVREDNHQLYGFTSEPERRMFRLLLGTSGIGPKIALSALSSLGVRELMRAVVEGDVRLLSTVPGIGRKSAERIVVELKDRIGESEALQALTGAGAAEREDERLKDAALALTALGYNDGDARRMISETLKAAEGEDLSVEQVIKRALRR